jgi:hypothetical protein
MMGEIGSLKIPGALTFGKILIPLADLIKYKAYSPRIQKPARRIGCIQIIPENLIPSLSLGDEDKATIVWFLVL